MATLPVTMTLLLTTIGSLVKLMRFRPGNYTSYTRGKISANQN